MNRCLPCSSDSLKACGGRSDPPSSVKAAFQDQRVCVYQRFLLNSRSLVLARASRSGASPTEPPSCFRLRGFPELGIVSVYLITRRSFLFRKLVPP